MVLLAALGAATADEPSRARPAYREIRVPAAELETWLARGEWRAIGRAEFETLVRGATPDRGRPPSAWIARAVYTATFSGQMLDGGRFAWDVRRDPSSARALLPLDPLRLAVEHVGWASNGLLGSWWRDHAMWGAARDGSVHLLVDRPQGRAEGRWNLRGRRVGRNVEFSLHVAPAAVSELHLDLPE
ncbi:MAG TPA: hypothetical protein VML55_15405, partial [Planctomycetaceae bacterium]|nr:hypothetical protein [Planctomycetaceae bacterium]